MENVEVQSQGNGAWRSATLLNISNEGFLIKLSGSDEVVVSNRVRPMPVKSQQTQQYRTGDKVEVLVDGEWCLAEILQAKTYSCFVHYVEFEDVLDELVDVTQIRPINDRELLQIKDFSKVQINVIPQLKTWSTGINANKRFQDIALKTDTFISVVQHPNNALQVSVQIFGKQEDLQLAQSFIEIILSHQKEVAWNESQRQAKIQNLEKENQLAEQDKSETFTIPTEYVGRIIGTKGENINKLKQTFNVQIEIQRSETESTNVQITGKVLDDIQKCKLQINIQKVTQLITFAQAQWLQGHRFVFSDVKTKSGILDIQIGEREAKSTDFVGNFENETVNINFVGTQENIETAYILLDTHLSFVETYKEKQEQNQEITDQLKKFMAIRMMSNPVLAQKNSNLLKDFNPAERQTSNESPKRGGGASRRGRRA